MRINRKLKLAFIMDGNLGSILIRTNLIKAITELFDRDKIEVYFFAHPKQNISETIFKGLDFIDYIKKRTEIKESIYKDFDLVVRCETFPLLLHYNKRKIYKNKKMKTVIKQWKKFYAEHSEWIENIPIYRPNIYKISANLGKNCINTIDINNALNMSNDFIYVIKSNNDNEILKKLKIKEPFITLNRGSYTIADQSEGTRVWPIEYYNELIKLLKNKYPHIQLVQLSESKDCDRMNGIDLDLCGKTTLEELKTILYKATLHIDGEGGMVHLRKALNAKPSVVLFGSTSSEYFGYDENINISGTDCPAKCVELHPHWIKKCLLSSDKALCLISLKPKLVLDKIDAYFTNTLDPVNQKKHYEITQKMISDTSFHLDDVWVQEWLAYQMVFSYHWVEISLKDIRYQHLFADGHSEVLSLENNPAIEFLKGNTMVYNEYNEGKYNYTKDKIHNEKHFNDLIQSMNKAFDTSYPIIIGEENIIKDGFHRASFLYHKFGAEYKVKVIKMYGFWQVPKMQSSTI